jgi:hypothetical protein
MSRPGRGLSVGLRAATTAEGVVSGIPPLATAAKREDTADKRV